jgi:hypothetical protein
MRCKNLHNLISYLNVCMAIKHIILFAVINLRGVSTNKSIICTIYCKELSGAFVSHTKHDCFVLLSQSKLSTPQRLNLARLYHSVFVLVFNS